MGSVVQTDIVNFELIHDLTQVVIPKEPNCEFNVTIDTHEFLIRVTTGSNNISYISIVLQSDPEVNLCWERNIKLFVNLILSKVHVFTFVPLIVHTLPAHYNYNDFQNTIALYHGYQS